jgi:hypothetical protein
MRDDEISDAKAFTDAKIDIHPVAEHGVDDPTAVPNRDQAGAARPVSAAPAHKAEPSFQRNAGVVQINKRVGGPRAFPVYRQRLELLVHGLVPCDSRNWREVAIPALIWIKDSNC